MLVVCSWEPRRPRLLRCRVASAAVGLLLASASTLAGNLTLLASLANLIVVEQARHRGVQLGWRDYLKLGLPVTALTLALDLALLGLLE